MSDFFAQLADPAMGFIRIAMLVGSLAAVAFGIMGSYVVARRITYLAGAIAHSVLGGIGFALYLQRTRDLAWLDPFWGALGGAILAAVVIGLVSIRSRQREDTVIGALWAMGMAAGLLFLAKTPGYVDPMSYLFGNILLLGKGDVILVAGLDLIILLAALLFYNKFLAVCFDEEFARLRSLPTERYYISLLILTSLTVVLLVRVVGIVMVVALLTLPAAVASYLTRTLWQMMIVATIFCMLFTNGGLLLSLRYDLPAGPAIILVAGGSYLLAAAAYAARITRARPNN